MSAAPLPPAPPFTRPFAWSLIVTAGVGLVVWIVFCRVLPPSIWPPAARPEQCECLAHDWIPGTEPRYAESALARTIREPQNSWSCLAYVFVAALVLQRSRDGLMRWFALAVAALGLGALLYHASGSRTLRHLDVASLYWVYGMVLCLAAVRVGFRTEAHPRPGWWATGLGLGVGIAAVLATVFRNVRIGEFKPLHVSVATGATATAAALLLFILCLRRRSRTSWLLWLGSLALLAVGVVLQVGDRPGNWLCFPGGPIQPHALWHVSSAACLALTGELLDARRGP